MSSEVEFWSFVARERSELGERSAVPRKGRRALEIYVLGDIDVLEKEALEKALAKTAEAVLPDLRFVKVEAFEGPVQLIKEKGWAL